MLMEHDMVESFPLYVGTRAFDCTTVEIECETLARAVDVLDKMRASGINAEFKGWAFGRASFAVAFTGMAA
jgi:hypothetical protein